MINLTSYDYIIVAFSGGKDSVACVLHLLEKGVDKNKIELWHHCVDGKEEPESFMDWPVTEDYCRKFAEKMGLKVKFSWKKGGFKREMLREGQRTAPNIFQDQDDNLIECGGQNGKLSTRRKFPQVSASLSVRWCSAYLKIDVCTMAITNQPRFVGKRTLVVSGERAEESSSRAKYNELEPDRSDRRDGKRVKRHVDHWRPVHKWIESDVWEIFERWNINPHIAYRLGWGRLSCIACIFGSNNQWASLNSIAPSMTDNIADYEDQFGLTIHRTKSLPERISEGTPYENMDERLIKIGLSKEYTDTIIVDKWELPNGAYGESDGPT